MELSRTFLHGENCKGGSRMLNQEEFFELVKREIKSHLPYEYFDAKVTISEIPAPYGEIKHSISVSQGEKTQEMMLAALIDLNPFYRSYQEFPEELFMIMETIAEQIQYANEEARKMPLEENQWKSYEWVKEHLYTRLCDRSRKEYLEAYVHECAADYALTYMVEISGDEDFSKGFSVTPAMLKIWDVTPEQLRMDAAQNQNPKNKPVLFKLDEYIEHSLGVTDQPPRNYLEFNAAIVPFEKEANHQGIALYGLTNESKMFGAAMIMRQEVLEQVADYLGTDFYVLPSSVHETLLLPADGSITARELQNNVIEINGTLSPEDRLSDQVAYYDREKKQLENAVTREERLYLARQKAPEGEKLLEFRQKKEKGPSL